MPGQKDHGRCAPACDLARGISPVINLKDDMRSADIFDIRPVKDFRNKFPTIHKNENHFGKDLNREFLSRQVRIYSGWRYADIDGSIGQSPISSVKLQTLISRCELSGEQRLAGSRSNGSEAAKKINQSEMTDVHKKVRDMPVLPVYAEDDHRTIKEKAMAAVGIIRSAENLEELLHLIDMTHSETVTGAVTNRSFQMYSEIKTIEAIAKSALLRTETRGGHFREDFPGNNINDMDTIVSLKDGKMNAQFIERKRENQTILH